MDEQEQSAYVILRSDGGRRTYVMKRGAYDEAARLCIMNRCSCVDDPTGELCGWCTVDHTELHRRLVRWLKWFDSRKSE